MRSAASVPDQYQREAQIALEESLHLVTEFDAGEMVDHLTSAGVPADVAKKIVDSVDVYEDGAWLQDKFPD